MAELGIIDMEAHPSMSFAVTGADVQALEASNSDVDEARYWLTCSLARGGNEKLYELRARNFFGAVPSFFLEDDEELARIAKEYGAGRMMTGEVNFEADESEGKSLLRLFFASFASSASTRSLTDSTSLPIV